MYFILTDSSGNMMSLRMSLPVWGWPGGCLTFWGSGGDRVSVSLLRGWSGVCVPVLVVDGTDFYRFRSWSCTTQPGPVPSPSESVTFVCVLSCVCVYVYVFTILLWVCTVSLLKFSPWITVGLCLIRCYVQMIFLGLDFLVCLSLRDKTRAK